MKLPNNKRTTIILGILCLIMLPVIIILAGHTSANGELDPLLAELEHTKGLLEYEIGMTAWYEAVQLEKHKQSASTIQGLVNKIAGLEQEKAGTYQASLVAYNNQVASYNALLAERDDLSGKLTRALILVREPKIVEVVKVVQAQGKDWVSVGELEEFLANDDTDNVTVFVGSVVLNSACEEKAFQLRERAFEIGKRLETEDLTPPEYKKWYGETIASDRLHCINKAVIGNEVWYIEPSDDRIWIGAYLD